MTDYIFDTITYGKVYLREVYDCDTSMWGEGFIEVKDENNKVIAEIYNFDIDDIDDYNIEDLIDENYI